MHIEKQRYLTVDDVAKRFGVNSTTVYRLTQKGILPAFKVGGQLRFNEGMLEAWVDDQVTIGRLKKSGWEESSEACN